MADVFRFAPPPNPLDGFSMFIGAVRERLLKGSVEYGDRSFGRPEAELMGELQQECLDLAGWGFVLWTRLERLRRKAATAPAVHVWRPCRLDVYLRRRQRRRAK